jgi:hypothetical protein
VVMWRGKSGSLLRNALGCVAGNKTLLWIISPYLSKVSNLQPVTSLSYLGSLFEAVPTYNQSVYWIISVHFSKLSDFEPVTSLCYLGSPFQALKLTASPLCELSRLTFPSCPAYDGYFTELSRLKFRSSAAHNPSFHPCIWANLSTWRKSDPFLFYQSWYVVMLYALSPPK